MKTMSTTKESKASILDLQESMSEEPETSSTTMILVPSRPPSDPSSEQRMRAIELSGSLEFWNRPEEDVYTLDDGVSA